MPTALSKLNNKQRIFCEEYLTHWNGSKAAIAAGYSSNCPRESAVQVLASINVKAYIDKQIAKAQETRYLDKELWYQKHRSRLTTSLADLCTWNESGFTIKNSEDISEDVLSNVQEFTVHETNMGVNAKIRMKDDRQAFEHIGKHLGLIDYQKNDTDKTRISVFMFEGKELVRLESSTGPETIEHSSMEGTDYGKAPREYESSPQEEKEKEEN